MCDSHSFCAFSCNKPAWIILRIVFYFILDFDNKTSINALMTNIDDYCKIRKDSSAEFKTSVWNISFVGSHIFCYSRYWYTHSQSHCRTCGCLRGEEERKSLWVPVFSIFQFKKLEKPEPFVRSEAQAFKKNHKWNNCRLECSVNLLFIIKKKKREVLKPVE